MSNIEIIEREIPKSIEIYGNTTSVKLPKFFKDSYKEIYTSLEENDCNTDIAPYARYTALDWEAVSIKKSFFKIIIEALTVKWNVYAGAHCNKEVFLEEPLVSYEKPKSKFLKTIHYGSYIKVGKTYLELLSYAKKHKLKLDNESFEFYLNDPKITKKIDLETEVLIPIEE
jgi:effector-binding domain-containing protein